MLKIKNRFRETEAEITDYYGRKITVSNAVSGMAEVKYGNDTLYFDTAELEDLIDALYSKNALDKRTESIKLHGVKVNAVAEIVSGSRGWPTTPEAVREFMEMCDREENENVTE